jgi:hypothetical protein
VLTLALTPLDAHGYHPTHRVPWHQMDLSDPAHPRLLVPAGQLEAVEE